VGASLVVELAALSVAAGMAGGGHGTYVPATILFPLPILSTLFIWNIAAFGLAIAQWPSYAALILFGARNGHAARAAALISLAHVGGLILAMFVLGDKIS